VLLLSRLISDVRADSLMMSGAIGVEQVKAASEFVAGIAPSVLKEMEALQAGKCEEDLCTRGLYRRSIGRRPAGSAPSNCRGRRGRSGRGHASARG
jgi:hypothetical protein